MCSVEVADDSVIITPKNALARGALIGLGPVARTNPFVVGASVVIPISHLEAVGYTPASMLKNGQVGIVAAGRTHLVHFRRKDRVAFEGFATHLQAQVRRDNREISGDDPRHPRSVSELLPLPTVPHLPAMDHAGAAEPTIGGLLEQMSVVDAGLPLDEQIEVNGETHYSKSFRKLFRAAGMPITMAGTTLQGQRCVLVPEPWNEHDPNAVAVVIEGQTVGHVPARLAVDYSPRLLAWAHNQKLIAGAARVWVKDDGGVIRARVTILVPEVNLL